LAPSALFEDYQLLTIGVQEVSFQGRKYFQWRNKSFNVRQILRCNSDSFEAILPTCASAVESNAHTCAKSSFISKKFPGTFKRTSFKWENSQHM